MINRTFLGVVLVTLFSVVSCAYGAEARKPNVILVLADDLGAAELGCYGNRENRTPNLDRMAEQGLRLETFYATPLCTPTRVCTMTGQYGFRNGYLGMGTEAFTPAKDSPQYEIGNHYTIGDVMKAAGYATAMAGKWQLPGRHPTLIHDCGFDEYRMWAYAHNWPAGTKYTGRYEGKADKKPARFWNPSIVENGKYIPTKRGDYGPDMFMDFILDFARRHKNEPFFVYHTSVLTHAPWEETPDPEHKGKRLAGGFKSNLEYLDHVMGRLRAGLEEMDLARNTVVVFVGDNGTGGRGKGQVIEKGVRVPFIVWGPGLVKPLPQASLALGDLTDILPTLADLAHSELPKDKVCDGKSMVPLLRGESAHHRDWIYSFLEDGRVLRSDRWLLEMPKGGGAARFFDCGESRDGRGYKDVTSVKAPEVEAARAKFAKVLGSMPEPKPRVISSQPANAQTRTDADMSKPKPRRAARRRAAVNKG